MRTHSKQESALLLQYPETVSRLKRELFEADFNRSPGLMKLRDLNLAHYISEAVMDIFKIVAILVEPAPELSRRCFN